MELREIADLLHLGNYAPEMDAIYQTLPQDGTPACDLAAIDRLQADYDTFGEFYADVRRIAEEINNDPIRSAWIRTACAYTHGRSRKEINRIPVPPADGTLVTSMLPLYILVYMLPGSVAEYQRRGFSEEEIGLVMHRIWDGMRIVKRQTGMPGINKTYFQWQTLFALTQIFEFPEGLQFELRSVKPLATYIRNKTTGQVVPLVNKGLVHRSGEQMVGSAGYEDEEDSFEASVSEDEENIYGYGAYNGKVETVRGTYPKEQWQVCLRPGDKYLSLHIPEGADISPEVVLPQIEKARRIAKERFPEHVYYEIFGSSWILNRKLLNIVKPESNIARFLQLFTVHPIVDDATSIFSFIFNGRPEDLNDLPENSSLHRGLKKLYLDGDHLHIFVGIVSAV